MNSRLLSGAFAPLLLAAACGGTGAPRSEIDRNVLHLYMESDPASLDPIQAVDVYRGRMVVYLYDGLVQYEDDGIAPNLAERWEISEDGRVYTFHLRDDVTFHNGRALVADAISHATLPGVALGFMAAYFLGYSGRSLFVLLGGAALSAALAVFAINAIRRHTRLKEDAAVASVLGVFFGLGIALL